MQFLQKKEVKVKITFWKNGFQVDDGPIRSFNDPQNKQFLDSVQKGEIPDELMKGRKTELDVDLIDKKTDDFVPPKPKLVPFSGSGQSLGSTSSTSSAPPPSSQTPMQIKIDESQPVTTLQIRLHDGTRLVAKFNHTHRVQDIRNYIDSSHRVPSGRRYEIMTTFPKKVISNGEQTLEQAGLLNAVIVQSLV